MADPNIRQELDAAIERANKYERLFTEAANDDMKRVVRNLDAAETKLKAYQDYAGPLCVCGHPSGHHSRWWADPDDGYKTWQCNAKGCECTYHGPFRKEVG